MAVVEIILGIIICVLAVALTTCVMLQSGKEKSLSGSIAGAGESFFSKNKGKTNEKKLSFATSIIAVVFAVVVVATFVVTTVLH